ncbi:MAG: hypothetical protein QME58_09345 [Bacteroidota bacterium]|nr:hypothetical protein [Bacteroidota bacterium]
MVTTLKKAKKLFSFKTLKYVYSEEKKTTAVQLNIEDFFNLIETLNVIEDKNLMRSIQRGLKDISENKPYYTAEFKKQLGKYSSYKKKNRITACRSILQL